MTYDDAIRFWASRINFEVRSAQPSDLKLERMREMLRRLGDPQSRLRTVHITGTKGKGSTAAMLAAIGQASGWRVGLFTSPHLEHVEERIRVNGLPITPADLARHMTAIAPIVEDLERQAPITFFEIITALAWRYFAEQAPDLVVLEVGLGGRFDSTNVCQPVATIITTVGYDHMAQLGRTLAEIAYQKAGIIKPGVPCLSGVSQPEPRTVIQQVAREQASPLRELGADFLPYDGTVGLLGDHQRANAALAREAALLLKLPAAAIRDGIATVDWPARIEVIRRQPAIILDCAHNVPSAEALVQTLAREFPDVRRRVCLFAVSSDKQYREMLPILSRYFDDFVFTRYTKNPRAVPPETLISLTSRPSVIIEPPAAAWEKTLKKLGKMELLAITGSVFLAGEMKEIVSRS